MKIVDCRMCLLTAAMCWAASASYGQQAAELDPAAPEAAQQGQAADQQHSLLDQQSSHIDAQPGQADRQQRQLEPPQDLDQRGQAGQPGLQQDRAMSGRAPGQPGEPGMAGEGGPGVLGVLIIESAGPGVLIREVVGGSAAEAAGLEPGDVILEINGEGIDSPPRVTQMIRAIPAGQQAMLNIWRDGQEQEIPATLQAAQRSPYRVNFRGGEGGSMRGDLAARTQRLEAQLAAVMQELQRLRQEVMQLRAARTGQPSEATGFDSQLQPDATQPGLDSLDATQPGFEQPGIEQPGLEQPDATQPAEETPAEPSATESDPALPF